MTAAVVEIVYALNEEDILSAVRQKWWQRFKDPWLRTRVTYWLSYALSVAGLVELAWLVVRHRFEPNMLSSALFLIVIGLLSGRRSQQMHRKLHKKVKDLARKTDWLVLRAYHSGFSITRPGISESSINWTIVKHVNLTSEFLLIVTQEDTTYKVPTRYISADQWAALQGLLREIWDVPEPEKEQAMP
jgi:hypothetical protein